MPQKISVVPGRQLDDALAARWIEIQSSNPALESPYFHPQFTRIVAGVRSDVEVAVIEDGSQIVGFFPFQRDGHKIGKPVGHPLSDYQGVICGPEVDVEPLALLRACRLGAWDFDHVPTAQAFFRPFHTHTDTSPLLNLQVEFNQYLAEQKARGSRLETPLQMLRKVERDVGPLLLEVHVPDLHILHFIMAKKSEQFRRTNQHDIFQERWIRHAVEAVFATQVPGFSGSLSVLYAGSERIAALMGIRSLNVWHVWFLGFEDRFSRYSPGFLLYLTILREGSALGVKYLDFGGGEHSYKRRLMNDFVPVAGGSVALPGIKFSRAVAQGLRDGARALVLKTPFAGIGRRWVRQHRRKSWKVLN